MPARFELGLAEGRLRLAWPAAASLDSIVATCQTADGTRHEGEGWRSRDGAFECACGPLTVRLTFRGGRAARIRLRGTARQNCEIVALGVAARLEFQADSATWWVYNGYQSWDAADVVPAGGARPSYWTAAVADADGRALVMAARSAARLVTRFDLKSGRLAMTQGAAPGPLEARSHWTARRGQLWRGEDLVLQLVDDVWDGLAELSEQVFGPRRRRGDSPPRRVPQGWLSWYHYGTWVTREDVLQNAGILADGALAGLGYDQVLVDDGWQEAYGDWIPNRKFDPSLGDLAARLIRRGQVPGLWIAPFLVSTGSDLALHGPADWFLSDPYGGGRLIDPVHVSFGPMYVLDARRRRVQDHLERTFAGLREQGFRHFKIDFLYAGAYPGVRALRDGLRAIRRGARDGYLCASGAPLLPLAGLVDGCRIGQDTATPLYDFEKGEPVCRIFGDEVLWIARNTACRHFLDRWFQLDPDAALVGANLTVEQARQLVTVVALAGGPFFATDDLARLAPERLALLTNPEVQALVGGPPARPDWDPTAHPLAAVWRRDDVLAAFNWAGPARQLVIEAPPRRPVRDLWNRVEVEFGVGDLELKLPPSGVHLLKFEGAGRLRAWLE